MVDTNTCTHNANIKPLPPPNDKKLEIKDKYSLILEIIWLNLLILPCFLFDIYKMLFPGPGKSLKGQVVLVTGAGHGLGKGLALEFAKEGCKVVVADYNKTEAMETAAEIVKNGGIAKAYFTNVAVVQEIKELRSAITKDLGPVDIVVNNAGLIYENSIENYSEEAIKSVIAVNLTSHFWMAREFLPAMKERNSGHIVAISSIAGLSGSISNVTPYVASKFGLTGFMEVLHEELEMRPGNNIKTTTVYPYFINTSANYVNQWDVRIPPISIREAVDATITAVKREQLNITIPSSYYTLLRLVRLLPQYVQQKLRKVFYVRIHPLTEEKLSERFTTRAIMEDLFHHKES